MTGGRKRTQDIGSPMMGELDALADDATVLIIGADPGDLPRDREFDSLPGDIALADLQGLGVYDLGIVVCLSAPPEPLLGRLRDIHVRRLLVTGEAADRMSPGDMLALGFEGYPYPDGPRRAYLYDRDSYNREREWNSPENWAHPDNFDKYRW